MAGGHRHGGRPAGGGVKKPKPPANAGGFDFHLHGIPAAKVTVSGRDHFSLCQRLTQGAAGVKRRVVGRLRADHALANEVHPLRCRLRIARTISFPWLISQLASSNHPVLEWGRDTACSFPAPVPYDLFSSSRSVMFRRLIPSVDPLCSSAEVVGGSTPATPSAISVRLKPTMKR